MSKRYILALLASATTIPQSAMALEVPINCASPMEFCRDEFVQMSQGKTSIEDTIKELPIYIRRNLTLKRGNNLKKRIVGPLGPHGHRVGGASGSATPEQPRVFVWDEKTGFTASWNSGNSKHTAHDRIDLYDFDFKTKTHRLEGWFPGKGMVNAQFKDGSNGACIDCHGASQRPIFPMYPDWPQFYGEFNDEMSSYAESARALRSDLKKMANEFQPLEKALYFNFLIEEAKVNPRYSLLYAVKPPPIPQERANPYYPFRPRTTTSPFSDVSRAFYNRPNLRLGVMYNRLTALQIFEKIKKSPIYQKYPDVIFYSLMDCNWDAEGTAKEGQELRKQILGKLLAEVQSQPSLKNINLRGIQFPDGKYLNKDFSEAGYSQIPYEDLLALLDLKIEDVDIRFQTNASFKVGAGYGVFDPKAFYHTDNAMDIGYIKDKYEMNPICDEEGTPCNFSYKGTYMEGLKYFNSYFDGSATTNELLAAQMLLHLTTDADKEGESASIKAVRSTLKAKVKNPTSYFETLQKKYSRFAKRLELDRNFFKKMDLIGPWIQLPFSPDMLNVQNREPFWSDGSTAVRLRHAQWASLKDRQARKRNSNSGQNLCWSIYDSMKARLQK